jgi:hypothetical protein
MLRALNHPVRSLASTVKEVRHGVGAAAFVAHHHIDRIALVLVHVPLDLEAAGAGHAHGRAHERDNFLEERHNLWRVQVRSAHSDTSVLR